MTRLYIILEDKTSLKKFCYLNGYKLLDIISFKDVSSSIIERFLHRNNINLSFKKNKYTAYIIDVKKSYLFLTIFSKILKIFLEDTSIIINITKSKYFNNNINSLDTLILNH